MDYERLYNLLSRRRSIRKFKDLPLSDELIQKIIAAVLTAPSSMNSQPWQFIVVKDKAKKRALRELYSAARKKLKYYEQDTSFVEKATPILVVCEDSSFDKVMSCSMAIQNMFIAAQSLGIGSLPSVTILQDSAREKELCACFNVTPPKKIVLVTYFGYSDENLPAKPKKDANGLVFIDSLK